MVAAAVVLVLFVVAAAELVSNDLVGQALGPVALAPDADDGAGDAGPPSADADFTLPVPTPLEDDRVVAAFAPLVNLSCKRSDYGAAAELPAAAVYAAAETAARDRALAAPAAPTAVEVDALLTEHLFAAALSPVLALSAAEIPAASSKVAAAGACPALLQHTFNRLQTG
ncbi:MAG: hypothetical protein ABI812_06080, partial [Betaproteobacteria bacterium]